MILSNFSDVPVSGVTFASLSLNHLLKLTTFDENRCGRALLLFLLGFLLKHLYLILQAREDETNHRRAAVKGIARIQPLIKRSNLTLVALELHPLGIARDFLPLHQRRLNLL